MCDLDTLRPRTAFGKAMEAEKTKKTDGRRQLVLCSVSGDDNSHPADP